MVSTKERFTEDIINRINMVIKNQPELSRSHLSRIICDWLDWRGPNGKEKVTSCRAALQKLHKRGDINLPPAKPVNFNKVPFKEKSINYEWPEFHGSLSEIKHIEIIKIERGDKYLSKLWRTMMDKFHYLEGNTIFGAQIRYLFKSEMGWLGGLSFSSAVWAIESRDKWIGWSYEVRKQNLDKVVCNSRFLILPGIKVKNLATHLLSKVIKQLQADWLAKYDDIPVLLETFIDKEKFLGTMYQAANWENVGQTKGRGRQDRSHKVVKSIKDVYLYPLSKDFRKEMGIDSKNELTLYSYKPKKKKNLIPNNWAEEEFGQSDIGDERLDDRLLILAQDFYANPQANIPLACGSRHKTKAAYRFFDNKRTNMDNILRSHYDASIDRIAKHAVVLAVQDTTSLNYSTHKTAKGLGTIGAFENSLGLYLHDTMAFNLEGTPLGLLDVQYWARDPNDFGKKKQRLNEPIENKESFKWLKSLSAVNKVQEHLPNTTLISVGDRESDIYELMSHALEKPKGAKILIRARDNRYLIDEQKHLWEFLTKQKSAGIQDIQVPRQGKRAARTAKMEVRFAKVKLRPPKGKKHLNPVTIYAVYTCEINAPDDATLLEWMLLTTIEVSSFTKSCDIIAWYTLRWGIEVYHRTLKSGCKIEDRQLGNANRIESCLAIDMVIAWRIYHLSKLGRETPNVPCTVYFEEEEWKALSVYEKKNYHLMSHRF